MKRLLLALALVLVPGVAFGQCNGVFPNNTVCGNITGAGNLPRPTSPASFLGAAGGTNGQIQYNNSSALAGFTMNGDCTVVVSTGAITCTKTNGAPFGPSATNPSTTGSGAVALATAGRISPLAVNTIRFASQFTGADWCVKLVNANNEIGINTPGTIVVDSNAVPGACTASAAISLGAHRALYFVSGTEYTLNQQLQLGTNSRIEGIGAGEPFVNPGVSGTRLKWTGANGTAMVKVFGAAHASMRHLGLDCNNTTNCAGIWMDSANDPSSTNNTFEDMAIVGFEKGIIIGLSTTTTISGGACSANFRQSGCSQNDSFKIDNVHLRGNCGSTTSVGYHINSQNAGQLSSIDRAGLQCVNIGVDILNMNGNLRISGVSMGSVVGISATNIQIRSAVQNGPMLVNNETEGGVYAISSVGQGPMTWMYNTFNQPSVIGGAATIASIGNLWNGLSLTTAQMTSYSDVVVGLSLGTNMIYRVVGSEFFTVATLPACVSARRGQRYTVSDSSVTTFNSIVAAGGANVIHVGCDGTNWRVGN